MLNQQTANIAALEGLKSNENVPIVSPYPLSSRDDLLKQYLGKSIKTVPSPAAVLDLSKVKENCTRMLDACQTLELGWRAHIKTHKTTELTRLQVGEGAGPANIIVSTVSEAEHVLPLLLEFKSKGRVMNLLYAFPVTPSLVPRLSLIAKSLGPRGLSLMIDHPEQLKSVVAIHASSGIAPDIFLKIDVGAKRAGVEPLSEIASCLISSILELESTGQAHFLGLYAHAGQSYYGSSRTSAIDYLRQEFEALLVTAQSVHSAAPETALVLSVGATPTSTAIRNLLVSSASLTEEEALAISILRATIQLIKDTNSTIEIHAGVYPTLDIQQLSTHALPTEGPYAMLGWNDLALTIVAEVASIYPNRGTNGTTEYLITAGTLALGREPCRAYPGWGVLTNWNRPGSTMPLGLPENFSGFNVGRISQEHGIVTWRDSGESSTLEGDRTNGEALQIGQKVRIWPNHACIAGAGYGWYFVVDSSVEGKEDEIVDIWVRWRGW